MFEAIALFVVFGNGITTNTHPRLPPDDNTISALLLLGVTSRRLSLSFLSTTAAAPHYTLPPPCVQLIFLTHRRRDPHTYNVGMFFPKCRTIRLLPSTFCWRIDNSLRSSFSSAVAD
ncbi:hypothetical protein ACP275_13G046600 [Erythranthe tilingii]